MARNDLFEWDELNLIRQEARILWSGKPPDRKKREEFCDWLEFVLCHVYAYGWQGVEDILGIRINVMFNGDTETVNLEIAGQTFRDRIMDEDTAEEILRVIDTEAHRDYNAGAYNAAKASGVTGLKKTWRTRMDDKVRDSHSYLEGVSVGIDDYFYTYTGARALYPGQFGEPDEDCNCRCAIEITR